MEIEPDVVCPTDVLEGSNNSNEPIVSGQMQASTLNVSGNRAAGLMSMLEQMWDVDADDVKKRLLLAFNPFSKTYFLTNDSLDAPPGSIVGGKTPDMWGPVWIYYTVVFSMLFGATMAGIASSEAVGAGRYEYSISILTGSAGIGLALTFGVPSLLWLAIQFFDLSPTLTLLQVISLYGYSNIIWVPMILIAGSPFGTPLFGHWTGFSIRWGAAAIGFSLSALFIFKNIARILFVHASDNVAINKSKGLVTVAAGVFVHAVFTLLLMGTLSRATHV